MPCAVRAVSVAPSRLYLASDLPNPTSLDILALQFAIKNVKTFTYDIGGYANIGILSGNTTWTTFYVPLTSLSQETHQLQFIIKNKSQSPETIYIDDIQLFYSPSATNFPVEYVYMDNRLQSTVHSIQ